MEERNTPLLVPAATFLIGVVLAPQLPWLPLPALIALVFLGLALRQSVGRWLACLALGALVASIFWLVPERRASWIDPSRPVRLVARAVGHGIIAPDRCLLPVRSERVGQGEREATVALDVLLVLPPDRAPPALGTTVEVRGYLARSSGFANGLPPKPGRWRLRLKSQRFLEIVAPPPTWAVAAHRLRQAAEALFVRSGREGPGVALARALVIGDRSHLAPQLHEGLRRSGLAHLLAVSGLHVATLALLALYAGIGLPRQLRYGLALVVVALYLLVVGPRPSVMRAALMGLLGFAALMIERPPQARNALACSVIVLLSCEPAMVSAPGFQLSVAATAGILLLAPRFHQRWLVLPVWLRQPLAVTVGAQLATMPFAWPFTAGVNPLSPLLNLVAVPWLTLTLASSLVWLVTAAVSVRAAAWLSPLLDALAAPFAWLAAPAAGPWLLWPVAPAFLPALGVAFCLAVAALHPRRLLAVVLAGLLLFSGHGAKAPPSPELVMLDVGQGDAILLRDAHRALLIDGGGWPSGDIAARVLVPALATLGVSRLEALVLTHPDGDHCGGLASLVSYLPVEEVWMAPGWPASPCTARLLTAPGARWRVLWEGERARLGRWRLRVLHPPAGARRGSNERSLVLMADLDGHRVLLTGDAEAGAERRLIRQYGAMLAADVLKVAHHGSKTSTSAAFLRAVQPRLALVSAGCRNPYGHPAGEIVARLDKAGVRLWRSDRHGAVRLRFLPTGIAVHTALGPRAGPVVPCSDRLLPWSG